MSSLQIPSSSVACIPYDKSRPNGFGYQPSLEAGVVFTVLFLGTFITHIWQMIRHKQYWLGAAFILGSFGELLGWVARLAANPCPYSTILLEMQIATLIMGM